MAYLDDTGLAYFWGKIKAWANSVFALLGHTHPASDVTAMTGYSMPSSTGAISSGDTLNQAVGKLEKAIVDADVSNVVHKTGDETVAGIKTFTSTLYGEGYLCLRSNSLTLGTAPSETKYKDFCIVDSNNANLAVIEYAAYADGASRLHMKVAPIGSTTNFLAFNINPSSNGLGSCTQTFTGFERNVAPSSDLTFWPLLTSDKNGNHFCGLYGIYNTDKKTGIRLMCYKGTNTSLANSYEYISVGFDASGNWYTYAPTPSTSDNSTKIATTSFVKSNLSNYAVLNDNNIFTASQYIKRVNPYLYFTETDIICGTGTTSSSATSYAGVVFTDKNDNTCGQVTGRFYGDGLNYFVYLGASDCRAASPASGAICGSMVWGNGTKCFMPEATNTVLLGYSNRRWKEIWCNQSSINSSSDERLKEDIASIPDEVLDAWLGVDWIQYRFKDAKQEKGNAARYHTGAIAQRIDRAFRERNLEVSEYGLFLHDEWEETPEAFDDSGNRLQTYQAAGDEYGIRYIEALCMEAACMRRENARLKKRVADLEERLAVLELRLGSE